MFRALTSASATLRSSGEFFPHLAVLGGSVKQFSDGAVPGHDGGGGSEAPAQSPSAVSHGVGANDRLD